MENRASARSYRNCQRRRVFSSTLAGTRGRRHLGRALLCTGSTVFVCRSIRRTRGPWLRFKVGPAACARDSRDATMTSRTSLPRLPPAATRLTGACCVLPLLRGGSRGVLIAALMCRQQCGKNKERKKQLCGTYVVSGGV